MSIRITLFCTILLMWSCTESNPGRSLPAAPGDLGFDSSASGRIDGSMGDGFMESYDGGVIMDGSNRPTDATASETMDGGLSVADAMARPVDASIMSPDGTVPVSDAAAPIPDAEPPAPDAECMSDCDGDEISIEDGDCDDGNPDIFPGQTELCDGLDNDCDKTQMRLWRRVLRRPRWYPRSRTVHRWHSSMF